MKIRDGFVSNSSTTSFTCRVCGQTEAFSDCVSYSEMDLYRCEKGHKFCGEHILPIPPGCEKEHKNSEADWEDEDETPSYKNHYAMSAERCPVCQMTTMDMDLVEPFLLKMLGWDRQKMFNETCKVSGGSYEKLLDFLSKK